MIMLEKSDLAEPLIFIVDGTRMKYFWDATPFWDFGPFSMIIDDVNSRMIKVNNANATS